MTNRSTTMRRSLGRFALAVGLTVGFAFAATACGDDSGSSDDAAVADGSGDDALSAAATRGEQLARSQGCAGCHGQDFGAGAGPGWVGLAGSEVQLADGTTVIADDAYLTRAIAEPSAEIATGYSLQMPANNLTDAEIADIVAFINSLADG